MLDHILGKPSANIRRLQAIGAIILALCLLKRKRAPWGLQWLEKRTALNRTPIWKALAAYSALLYTIKHGDDILGLNAPEPLREYYSRSFYRATWVFMALDAGFWSTMSIRPKLLRDVLSLLFSLYYLVFTDRCEEKVRKIRALVTVDHLRVSWNKGVDNPILRFARYLHSSKLTVSKTVYIPDQKSPRSSGSWSSRAEAKLEPAKCHVYFAGEPEAFESTTHIVLNYPGGGFVSMGPECHSDYLSAWAEKTRAVVVSVDYAKAPEYPYPYAIDQCYEVYREIVQTHGMCLGLDIPTDEPLRIVFAGDSAGGNITASVVFRILESEDRLPPPHGVVFIYGCFNVDIRAWMTPHETRMLMGAGASQKSRAPHTSTASLATARDHLHHVSPLAVTNKDDGYQQSRLRLFGKKAKYIDERVRVVRTDDSSDSANQQLSSTTVEQKIGYTPLAMGSSFTYFQDKILTPEMMRAMVIMYIGPNSRPDFSNDYYLSPIVAPDSLLERFPPVYFMCGEKDPMVDDTVIFAARIRNAKSKKPRKANARPHAPAPEGPARQQATGREYQKYRSSSLYARRHSQPSSYLSADGSPRFYIGSTDVSEDEEPAHRLPKSLCMTGLPHARLREAQPPSIIKVKILAGMSHGFMQMYSILPDSKRVANNIAEWLCELLDGAHEFSPYSRCASEIDHGDIRSRAESEDTGAASIFDRGLVDKHGNEIVSAANMVRRRGYGLAEPLN